MKTIYISPRHGQDHNKVVRLRVEDHVTEDEARADYFNTKFQEWCNEPIGRNKLKVTPSVERFFNRLKMMSETNIISLTSRPKLAARLAVSLSKVVHCLTVLKDAGWIKTKRFSNKTVKGYFLKY